jgi:GTP diphosphokinase / guanosine-3',5'-bis(diphosphate) 3'-diphosphatase
MSAVGSTASRLLAAAIFSADRHRDQRRKGARETPYINHPLEVAERIVRIGGIDDIEVLVAAILHDTIEDTETEAEEIEHLFGARVAALVLEVTDPPLTQAERKRLEIEHAPNLTPEAKLIKLSDKISNVADTESNPPASWSRQRRRDYLDFAEQIAIGCRGINAALDAEFARVLAQARDLIG